jgi:hypothetical protein
MMILLVDIGFSGDAGSFPDEVLDHTDFARA